jgi:hypothetical protein
LQQSREGVAVTDYFEPPHEAPWRLARSDHEQSVHNSRR